MSKTPFLTFWVALFLCGLLLGGCDKPTVEELSRVTSPDSRVDAVLQRKNVHSTVPFIYEVFVTSTSGAVDTKKDLILRGDRFEEIHLKWREPRFLEIHYTSGRIYSFTNFWNSRHVDNFKYVVEVRLKPKSDLFSLEAVGQSKRNGTSSSD